MNKAIERIELTAKDLADLTIAKRKLYKVSLAARISSFVGKPIEATLENLPDKFSDKIMKATTTALSKAADVAIFTMKNKAEKPSSDALHKLTVAATGAVGGAFGFTALAIELPISTTLMVRSIADIARSEGENIEDIESRLACMEVFALGGPDAGDDAAESGYFAVRAALSSSIASAAKFIAEYGIKGQGAPIIVRLLSTIAERFSIVITEKAAAQAVPIVGALVGAAVNTMFISHFQDIARGHFIVRRLERKYGSDLIQSKFDQIKID